MLAMSADEIHARAEAVARQIAQRSGWHASVIGGASAVGGGSAPGVELRTHLVAIAKNGMTADALEQQLRQLTPPIVARIERDRLVLDLRTVLPEHDAALAALIARI